MKQANSLDEKSLAAKLESATLLTRKEAAQILKCNAHTLEGWTHRKIGPPSYKFAGLVRYDKDELLAWMASQRMEVSQ